MPFHDRPKMRGATPNQPGASALTVAATREPRWHSENVPIAAGTAGADDKRPLVVTLQLDGQAQKRFDAERTELFPPGRTAVGAHVTLFHALPAHLRPDVEAELGRLATSLLPFTVDVTGVFSLGRGVAYRLAAEEAELLHRGLQERWRSHLTRQDAQPLRPHVTVQNKVEPEVAKATLDRLRRAFRPATARAVGLELWRYDGGPWTLLHRWESG
jgi:2'-5' RNA ligase